MSARARAAVPAALLATALAVTGCGVEPQRNPEPVPAERLPSASPRPESTAGVRQLRVWGARDERLVPVFVELSDTSVRSRLTALLDLGKPGSQAPTALPAGTRVMDVREDGDGVAVVLSSEVGTVPVADLPLVLGQIVFTVTEQPGPVRVQVSAAGRFLRYVDATGRAIERPLVRADFDGLLTSPADD